MTKDQAERRADQLRKSNRDDSVKFEVEPEREGAKRFVIRSYRNKRPTGSVWYI